MQQMRSNALVPFILSLVGLVLLFAVARFPFIGLALGIIALVLSVNARKTDPGPMVTAAFVISILVVVIGGIEMIAWVACFGIASSIAGGVLGFRHGLPRIWDLF